MNTIECNQMIDAFMGNEGEYKPRNYHCDWNELMPVIEKILDISLNLDSMEMYYDITDCIPSITQTYIAVKDFIVWYNQQI